MDLTSLFIDNCGTCSTKHAVLKQLAEENDFTELKLMLGIFKMNKINTPPIATLLTHNHLEYIPEAHCYLKFDKAVLDYTKQSSKPSNFINDLIEEIEITPVEISEYKIMYHKDYLSYWLEQNKQIRFSLEELWAIREACIQRLTN